MKSEFAPVERLLDKYGDEMVKTMVKMISIKSVSPKSGGEGEGKRADFLEGILKTWGLKVKRYAYKDETGTPRVSLVTKLGDKGKTLWLAAHIDTVSEGDITAWNTDPFVAKQVGDRIYGRGTNDDGQSVISSMYALKALMDSGARLNYNCGLVLAGNEEEGSHFGMAKLMDEGIFSKDDLFLVPDVSSEKGEIIEIGEKGLVWIKVTVIGKQVHASTPAQGTNAFRYLIKFLNEVDEKLHSKYTEKNPIFDPDYSTFEMTKHEKNVDSINIISGKEVAYIDCRVIPSYMLDEVVNYVKGIAAEKEYAKVKIEIELATKEDAAPITDKNSPIAVLLSNAVKDLRGITPKFMGIGGGTVAAFPRKAGIPAVCWFTGVEIAHRPNEFMRIGDMIADAKVFAYLYI